jgi:hypothetical protein
MKPPRDPGKPGPGNYITEDDPRWNPKTMGNKRGKLKSKPFTGRAKKNAALKAVAQRKATPPPG